MKIERKEISLPNAVGKGYKDFWEFKGRYRVVKGSRASKKSKTAALWYITNIMKYPAANVLVIRKIFRTLRDSCFAELKWAVGRLGVSAYWECKESQLEMTYIPTGQKIYFRGLDDPLKIASIAVESGVLCWLWIEEAYEITKESDFDMLDESIRGEVPDGLFKQITLTFNPWNERHWLKKRFFDKLDTNTMSKTVDYHCNEWLDAADRSVFENMRKNNPRRYKVAGLGGWGVADGLIYENWEEKDFNHQAEQFIKERPNLKPAFGLDFGYTNDPTALFCGLADPTAKELYVFDELYEKALTNNMIFQKIQSMGYAKERITADSAEPKSIDELRELGLYSIRAARKGRDSINNGIQYLQGYKIYVHPRCVNFITEISSCMWDEDRFGAKLNKPAAGYDHLLDAMRYAMEEFSKGDTFSFE